MALRTSIYPWNTKNMTQKIQFKKKFKKKLVMQFPTRSTTSIIKTAMKSWYEDMILTKVEIYSQDFG